MALNFLPSLQHIAAVKVALAVYYDDIIHSFNEFILADEFDQIGSFHISQSREERVKQRRKEMRRQLSPLLPKALVDQVVNILQPIVDELYFWVRDYICVIKNIQKSHIANNLCWKSEGTIDRIKTSRQLVRNESIDKRVRFVLACIHFWEQDVLQLWRSMTSKERGKISRIDSNFAVGFWMKWLKKNAVSPWTQYFPEYLNLASLEPIIIFDYKHKNSRIRLSSFFAELNRYYKNFFLDGFWPKHAHIDDLFHCYYLTAETDRPVVFPLNTKAKHVLCVYIDWPLQSHLFEVLNKMWDQLTPNCFEHLLRYIVNQKLSHSMEDFDYLKLLKDLWNRIPDDVKEYIKGKTTYLFVEPLLSYDENTSPLSLEETLQGCRDSIRVAYAGFGFNFQY
ncbi:uncharacterized protein LOC129981794 [Argiope bruennichi]|uniref:Uncharacterized protein n=1 Tax=Argiope bruennichi TaxID=94029 RepID=A0A8T0G7I4_ARGBR|nr:uncharacterized protein LOC129981794 [Argiope bruennichi]KAF8797233.1 hypothetical protein HNY73_001518 [Argiope bruennichi]